MNILGVVAAVVVAAAVFFPFSFSKYVGSTPFNVLVYAPQAFSSSQTITLRPGYYYIES